MNRVLGTRGVRAQRKFRCACIVSAIGAGFRYERRKCLHSKHAVRILPRLT